MYTNDSIYGGGLQKRNSVGFNLRSAMSRCVREETACGRVYVVLREVALVVRERKTSSMSLDRVYIRVPQMIDLRVHLYVLVLPRSFLLLLVLLLLFARSLTYLLLLPSHIASSFDAHAVRVLAYLLPVYLPS